MTTTKRAYRDTVFRAYMKEPENFRQLAEAVTGEKFKPEEMRENTLDDVLFNNPRNDISYNIGERSIFFAEHQSTKPTNMPLRMLIYLMFTYWNTLPEDLIYREERIKLPAPRFFTFYNGHADLPEKSTVRLSDSFAASADAEAVVTVYNINYEVGGELLQKCRPLEEYSYFIAAIQQNLAQGMDKETAVLSAMTHCQTKGIMKEFWQAHRGEVYPMINLQWNEEDARKSYIAQGFEQGMGRGQETERVNSIRTIAAKLNLTVTQAMEMLDIPFAEQNKYAALLAGRDAI